MQQLTFAWLAAGLFAVSLAYFLFAYLFTFGVDRPGGPTSVWPPVLIDLALFTLFVLHHSLFARTRIKRLVTTVVPPPLERAVYTLVASVLFLLVCAFWQPVPGVLYALSGPWRWMGYAAQAAGLVVIAAGSRALDVLDLSGVRQAQTAPQKKHGRNTETSNPRPHPLETGGVYGFVRHPLYLGWALFVFGAPDMTLTRFTFALISTLYLVLAIPIEERTLLETFGKDYDAYKRQVRWRMLPFVY